MIEVKDLQKSFGDAHVLKGISTSFEKGKTNLIIGQSGSGKTVFLKCLLGLFEYEKGSISYDGKIFSLLTEDEKRNLRAEIGMVFQGSALFDSMTIAENVMFPLQMFTNQSKSEMEDRVNFVLKRVNLEDAHHKMPSEASGGMQKRVAIARAIVNKPPILLADEPTGNLDPKLSLEIIRLFEEFNEMGVAVLIATHDLGLIARLRYRTLTLKQGSMINDGLIEGMQTSGGNNV